MENSGHQEEEKKGSELIRQLDSVNLDEADQ